MSSIEIAERTGKRHGNVVRDIRLMLQSLGVDETRFGSVYRDGKGEERACFHLPKRECIILISGYSVSLCDIRVTLEGLGIDALRFEAIYRDHIGESGCAQI